MGCSTVARTREAVQVASHVDICHDDGPAAQHDVWFAFDFGLARDFVSSILSVIISDLLRGSSPSSNQCMQIGFEHFHRWKHANTQSPSPRWQRDAARTYRLNVFRLVRLARHRRRSRRHGCCSSLLVIAARVFAYATCQFPLLFHALSSPKSCFGALTQTQWCSCFRSMK